MNFTKFEKILWGLSTCIVLMAYLLSDRGSVLSLVGPLIGVTSLIFVARGYVFGQILMVIFSIIYGIISYEFRYYGEMITYLGMTAPIAVFTVIAWIRHPYEKEKSEVEVANLGKKKIIWMVVLATVVTFIFYFILEYFNTTNLSISTVSITTSFIASYLMFFRNPYYAIAYAANDIILVILWVLATIEEVSYLSMTVCFCVFLVNDIYGYICWKKMQERQLKEKSIEKMYA